MNNIFIIVIIVIAVFVLLRKSNSRYNLINPDDIAHIRYQTLDDKYNEKRKDREIELNALLERVSKNGIDSLSKEEKNRLDYLANKNT